MCHTVADNLELPILVKQHTLGVDIADLPTWVDVWDEAQRIPWPEQHRRDLVLEQRVDDQRDRHRAASNRQCALKPLLAIRQPHAARAPKQSSARNRL